MRISTKSPVGRNITFIWFSCRICVGFFFVFFMVWQEWQPTCNKSLSSLSLITCECVYICVCVCDEGDYTEAHLKHKCMLSVILDMSQWKANHLNELQWDSQVSGALRFITSPIIVNRHPAGSADEPLTTEHVCFSVCMRELKTQRGGGKEHLRQPISSWRFSPNLILMCPSYKVLLNQKESKVKSGGPGKTAYKEAIEREAYFLFI